jgi:hypothetical protein
MRPGSSGRPPARGAWLMAKHEPIVMIRKDRYPVKSRPTRHFRSGFNIWYALMECPICGAYKRPLDRFSNREFFCSGVQDEEIVTNEKTKD